MSEHLNATQQNEKFDFAKFGSNFESDQSMVVGAFGRRAFRPNDQRAKDAPRAVGKLIDIWLQEIGPHLLSRNPCQPGTKSQ